MNAMNLAIRLFVVGLAIAVPGTLRAATIVESTFDTGDDGWRIGEFFSNSGDTVPTFVSSGGNPGGFIRTTDVFGVVAFQAPAEFLGVQSAAYGGSLHLDQRLLTSDGANYQMVLLSDNTLYLQFRTEPPGTGWTVYDIPFLAAAGWEVSDLGDNANPKPPATEAQLQQVLGNLTLFNLRADWQTGADRVDLDNVRFVSGLSPIPEPEIYAMMAVGLGLMSFVARRRKRQIAAA